MTSNSEQLVLSTKYGTIPPLGSAIQNAQFDTPELSVLRSVLSTSAVAMPQVAAESQFEQLVGTAINGRSSKPPSTDGSAALIAGS